MTRRHHVLIGSGPGSMSAAEAIRSRDDSAEIVVVGAGRNGYYSRPGLAYYLAKEEPEAALFPFPPRDIDRLGAQMLPESAVRIDPAARRVTLETGQALPYDRLLVATGSLAVRIDVPGLDLDGVTKLDDMDDARDLIKRSRGAKSAVVVGGGITALEIAEGLTARNVHVHYFMRKDRYWSNVLSETESRMVEAGLRAKGVQIHTFTELARILGRNGRVAAVETHDGTQIPCDLVAVAIGVLPQKALGEAAGLDCARGILVDSYLRSSVPDIFAAGDVAEVRDPVTGKGSIEVLWSSAVEKGRVAGLNMATEAVYAYDSGTPLNVTRLAGYRVTIMGTVGSGTDSDLEGLSRGDSETWRQLGESVMVESHVGDAHVRLALTGGVIAGAVVMGDQALSFPLQDLIEAKADVSRIAAGLQAPGAPIAQLIQELWQDWKAHVA